MKRIILIAITLLAITTISKADGFINPQSEYYFGRSYNIQYTDEVPTESLQYYFAYSLDNGMNWTRFSDTLIWTCPDTARATLPIMKTGDAKIGIFTNPNGTWNTTPYSFDTKFKYSDDFEFIQQPDTIYNGGSYEFSVRINPDETPEELTLQYSTDNGDTWRIWWVCTFNPEQYIKNINIDNGVIASNTIWRLCYDDPLKEVCRTGVIPYKERLAYFNFKTKGGVKEISDKAELLWESSYNFKTIKITTYFDNGLLDEADYKTDGIEINFAKNGEYVIVGLAQDANFSITKTVTFTVGDPCWFVKVQAIELRDSLRKSTDELLKAKKTISWADSTILDLNKKVDSLNSVGITQNKTIDSLQEYILILKTDSLKIQLIYTSGCVNEVKDETFVNNMSSIYANLTNESHIYIAVPEDLQHTALTWWCFDGLGNFVQAESTADMPDSIEIKQGMSHGVYFWYTLRDGIYKAYKFVI
jgi:hypothetical protein